MELFDIYSTGRGLDSGVPLRQPHPDDRAARNINSDHRMMVAVFGGGAAKWVPAAKEEFDIAVARTMGANTTDSLQDLTGQESGIVVYHGTEDGTQPVAIVCNWSSYTGLPHLFGAGLVDWPTEIPEVAGHQVDDFATLLHGDVHIDNQSSDDPELSGPATVYELGEGVTVIAPNDWN